MRSWYFCLLASALPTVVTADAAPWSASVTTPTHFEIQWKGKPAGYYKVDFTRENGRLIVLQSEELALSKMLIKAKSTWSAEARFIGQQLESVKSHTSIVSTLGDKDVDLDVVRTPQGYKSTSEGKSSALSADAWPLMFWDKNFVLRKNIFEQALGKSVSISAKPAGTELVDVGGSKKQCERFDITAEIDGKKSSATVWYEPAGRLCSMVRVGDFGSISYVRQDSQQPTR